jgi:chorismate mutase
MTSGEDDGRQSVDRIEQLPVSDWTDQDLLTKDEARGRLVDEIGRCRARLDELKANLKTNEADESELALLARRLNAMESIAGEYDEYLDGK